MDINDCPLGEDCSIHFRNDEDVVYGEGSGRLITYVGRYAVVTDEAPEPWRAIFGPRYDTTVIEIGEEGVLADMHYLPDGAREEDYIKFQQAHGSWANFRFAHEAVVDSVKAGTLELGE